MSPPAAPVHPPVHLAPTTPARIAAGERHRHGDQNETGRHLRRAWALVERLRAAVAARRGDEGPAEL